MSKLPKLISDGVKLLYWKENALHTLPDTEREVDFFDFLLSIKKAFFSSEAKDFRKNFKTPIKMHLMPGLGGITYTLFGKKMSSLTEFEIIYWNQSDSFVMTSIPFCYIYLDDKYNTAIKDALAKALDTKLNINVSGTDICILDLDKKRLAACALSADVKIKSLGDIIVHKDYRNQGFAESLIEYILKGSKEFSTSRIDGPYEFFLKLGFKIPIEVTVFSGFNSTDKILFKTYNNDFGYKRFSIVSNHLLCDGLARSASISRASFKNRKGSFEILVSYSTKLDVTNLEFLKKIISSFLSKEFKLKNDTTTFVFEKDFNLDKLKR